MGRRIPTERNAFDLIAGGIKATGNAAFLSGVPDLAARADGNVMWKVALRHVVVFRLLGIG
jgi:hypothetical protein